MAWTSIVAIYVLLWATTAFVLLPFGIRAASDQDVEAERMPGQADSAPVNFKPGRLVMRATLIAAVLCAVYVANYEAGWITSHDIDISRLMERSAKG